MGFIKFDADVKKEGGSLTLTAVVKRSNPFHGAFRKMISEYLKICKTLDDIADSFDKLTAFTAWCPLPQLKGKNNVKPPKPIVIDEEEKKEEVKVPVLPNLTKEEVYEIGLPLPAEYDDVPQTTQIG